MCSHQHYSFVPGLFSPVLDENRDFLDFPFFPTLISPLSCDKFIRIAAHAILPPPLAPPSFPPVHSPSGQQRSCVRCSGCELQRSCQQSVQHEGFGLCAGLDQPRDVCVDQAAGMACSPLAPLVHVVTQLLEESLEGLRSCFWGTEGREGRFPAFFMCS